MCEGARRWTGAMSSPRSTCSCITASSPRGRAGAPGRPLLPVRYNRATQNTAAHHRHPRSKRSILLVDLGPMRYGVQIHVHWSPRGRRPAGRGGINTSAVRPKGELGKRLKAAPKTRRSTNVATASSPPCRGSNAPGGRRYDLGASAAGRTLATFERTASMRTLRRACLTDLTSPGCRVAVSRADCVWDLCPMGWRLRDD